MSDDLVLSDAEQSEALKELEAASAPSPPAKDKRKVLLAIMQDRNQPYHVKSEAQRILDLGETHHANYFNQRFSDFVESLENHERQPC
jgi:hypothetical protein